MAWIKGYMVDAIDDSGIVIEYISRDEARFSQSLVPDIRQFCGYYWHRERNGKVIAEQVGPFKCWSAAAQNAYVTVNGLNVGTGKIVSMHAARKPGKPAAEESRRRAA